MCAEERGERGEGRGGRRRRRRRRRRRKGVSAVERVISAEREYTIRDRPGPAGLGERGGERPTPG